MCIPLVNRMSGRLAIFHPLGYSFIKNSGGAYLKILKEPLRRDTESGFAGVAPIHFKPHQRKKSEKQKFPTSTPPPKRYSQLLNGTATDLMAVILH